MGLLSFNTKLNFNEEYLIIDIQIKISEISFVLMCILEKDYENNGLRVIELQNIKFIFTYQVNVYVYLSYMVYISYMYDMYKHFCWK